MFSHVKIVCLSVGLLLVLSGLNSVSFAVSDSKPGKPAPSEAVSLQSAQSSLAAGVAFRAVVAY
jgi:hypothetical protein